MSSASIAPASAARLFRDVAPSPPSPPARGQLAVPAPPAPARPVDVRRWLDLCLMPVAAGVWLHVLAVTATHL